MRLFSIQESVEATQAYLRSGKTLEEFNTNHGIRGKTDGELVILDYHQINVKWTEPYGWACRGLILDAKTFDVIAMGLGKFFNSGEGYAAPIDWASAAALEKLDGTYVQRFWNPYKNEFQYSTRFQLPRDLVVNRPSGLSEMTWQQVINTCINGYDFNQDHHETVVLEAMSPLNLIVVSHETFKFAVLACRDNNTLIEKSIDRFAPVPKRFAFQDANAVKAFADTFDGTVCEGFVVVDKNYNRIKIKGISYEELHHLKDGLNSIGAIILLARNGNYSQTLNTFPQYKAPVETAAKLIENIIIKHEAAYEDLKALEPQKTFALAVQAEGLEFSSALFLTRAGKAASVRAAILTHRDSGFVDIFKMLLPKDMVQATNIVSEEPSPDRPI